MRARNRLDVALVVMAATGERPPCGEFGAHDSWLSEDARVRAAAAEACGPCPLLELCGAAAVEGREKFGVWGGRDRTAEHPAAAARRRQKVERGSSR